MSIDLDTIPQLAQKLLNYGALTSTRDVKMRWAKVGIISRLKEHGALKANLPHPFNLPNIETAGKVIGKYIHTYGPNQRKRNTRKTTYGATIMARTEEKYLRSWR